jgi:hypothetical protein
MLIIGGERALDVGSAVVFTVPVPVVSAMVRCSSSVQKPRDASGSSCGRTLV